MLAMDQPSPTLFLHHDYVDDIPQQIRVVRLAQAQLSKWHIVLGQTGSM